MTPVSHDPRTLEFWVQEQIALAEATGDVIMATLLAGINTGMVMLPADLSSLVSFDALNEAALMYLRLWEMDNLTGINQTTAQQVIGLIDDFITSGESFQTFIPKFQRQLEGIILSPARAKSIAVTEVTRVYAEGNMMSWASTGAITGKRWMTARDERVCPICGPLHERVVEIEAHFTIPPNAVSPELERILSRGQEAIFRAPPAHPNCRCWLQPFVDDRALSKQIEQNIEEMVNAG